MTIIERIGKCIENEDKAIKDILASLDIMVPAVKEIKSIISNCVDNHKDRARAHKDEVLCVWCKGEIRKLCSDIQIENENIKSLINKIHFSRRTKRKIKSLSKQANMFVQRVMISLYKE